MYSAFYLILTTKNKESPANAKGNVRCICEDPVQMKSKLTTMFHLDSTADDA